MADRKERKKQIQDRIPQIIKKVRVFRGITQHDAAHQLEVTQTQWSAYELGKNTPSIQAISEICDVLKIDKVTFFKVLLDQDLSIDQAAMVLINP